MFKIASLALPIIALSTAALAQEKTLYLGGSGGSIEEAFRTSILQDYEKKTGVKVEYVTGNSTDLLAKLQAGKSNQQLDVVFLDDGPMAQAVELGFC
ncbi:extracellular solute-binding protein, partial [Escherichia coli]|uniref:extracellular solute-binding protein n=2 Tax=Pseudomonadota TaxID=1224 RepID=UPI003D068278